MQSLRGWRPARFAGEWSTACVRRTVHRRFAMPSAVNRPCCWGLQSLCLSWSRCHAPNVHCSGAKAPVALDLCTFTGAPALTQRQLSPELFSRSKPYSQRR